MIKFNAAVRSRPGYALCAGELGWRAGELQRRDRRAIAWVAKLNDELTSRMHPDYARTDCQARAWLRRSEFESKAGNRRERDG